MTMRSTARLLEVLVGRRQNRRSCVLREDGGVRGAVSLVLDGGLLGNEIRHVSRRP